MKPEKTDPKRPTQQPPSAEVNTLIALYNGRRYAELESRLRFVVGQYPDFGFGWKLLGGTLQMQGKEALSAFQKVAELMPNDAEAHYNLGVVQKGSGRLDDAAASYLRAVDLKPDYAEAHSNLGNTLKDLGRLEDAVASYRRALEIKPDSADAHNNLGTALKDLGQLNDAIASYRRAVALKPDFALAYYNLGNAQKDLNQLDDAVTSYRHALEIKPNFADVLNNLGAALQYLGQFDAALASFRRGLELNPGFAEAHNNLGNALKELGQLDAALASYRKAVELKPSYAEAHSNMGNTLKELGQFDGAVISFRRTLQLKPDYAEVHSNLSLALKAIGQLDAAVASCRRALEIKPDFAGAHYNLGNILQDLGQFDDAVASYRRALQFEPDFAGAHNNLGMTLTYLGQHDNALASYRRTLELKPDYANAHNNLLFTLNYHPDLGAEEIFRAYQEYDVQHCIPLRSAWRAHSNDKDPNRRLRIGYVSPDFRRHSCRSFLEPLLAHHDKTRVEVFAYAELAKEDDLTARYKSYVEHWIPTRGMNDEALAERIRSDGIDILVELAGHTAKNRLLTFARKPAPVSLTWLGYGYTTGLGAIDYYLTDEASVPAGSEGLFAEQPWRIATPAYAYRPSPDMGEAGSLPALQRGYITFGTLTRSVRINHRTIRVWAELLKAVPNSRLVIDSLSFKDTAMQERLAARFAEHGISRERLEIGCHSPPWDVLRGIDIGLDCFPHNSGTTLFETLYMGVPYITLSGRPSVGRLGSSILQGAGHPEWIAHNEDEYVEIAVGLASELQKLSALRAGLRAEMEAGPLLDEPAFARKVEDAYRQMWQLWCKNHGQ